MSSSVLPRLQQALQDNEANSFVEYSILYQYQAGKAHLGKSFQMLRTKGQANERITSLLWLAVLLTCQRKMAFEAAEVASVFLPLKENEIYYIKWRCLFPGKQGHKAIKKIIAAGNWSMQLWRWRLTTFPARMQLYQQGTHCIHAGGGGGVTEVSLR